MSFLPLEGARSKQNKRRQCRGINVTAVLFFLSDGDEKCPHDSGGNVRRRGEVTLLEVVAIDRHRVVFAQSYLQCQVVFKRKDKMLARRIKTCEQIQFNQINNFIKAIYVIINIPSPALYEWNTDTLKTTSQTVNVKSTSQATEHTFNYGFEKIFVILIYFNATFTPQSPLNPVMQLKQEICARDMKSRCFCIFKPNINMSKDK